MKELRVVIETEVVSELDGKKGKFAGQDGQFVKVQVDGHAHPILFKVSEVKAI